MAERVSLKVILYHGDNDSESSARRKDLRATVKQWEPATKEQREKNPEQVLRHKKYDKFFSTDKLETIASLTTISTTLHTWKIRTLVQEDEMDDEGKKQAMSRIQTVSVV